MHGTLVAVGAGIFFAINAVLLRVTLGELVDQGSRRPP